jgi:hypothetical protein
MAINGKPWQSLAIGLLLHFVLNFFKFIVVFSTEYSRHRVFYERAFISSHWAFALPGGGVRPVICFFCFYALI